MESSRSTAGEMTDQLKLAAGCSGRVQNSRLSGKTETADENYTRRMVERELPLSRREPDTGALREQVNAHPAPKRNEAAARLDGSGWLPAPLEGWRISAPRMAGSDGAAEQPRSCAAMESSCGPPAASQCPAPAESVRAPQCLAEHKGAHQGCRSIAATPRMAAPTVRPPRSLASIRSRIMK
jgi:hypothetical protein